LPVLDDDAFAATPEADHNGDPISFGYQPRDWDANPAGSIDFFDPFPAHLKIPRSEWREIIEMRERHKATLFELGHRAGIRAGSQNGTSHCWAWGSVAAIEYTEVIQGEPHVPLSATAVACIAKNFRNVGGNTFNAFPVMAERGVPTKADWPDNRLDRSFDKPETWERAKPHKMLRWYELPNNDFDAMASCLLRGWPVTIGVQWWSHMICAVDLKALEGGAFGTLIRNSHGTNYGDQGFAVLTERKSTAFDQACPVVTHQ
jgi:hypothetical protein